ncbi:MAG: alpha/beta hydrolase, partial [Flavobacteriaceae bacterium]|nr:alpha/beta hydrolase [Flavobacteriaceae bacterium]
APKWSTDFAFRLSCKVQRVPISEKGKEFFAQGRSTFLDIKGGSAVLHTWGRGDKNLIFLHGWMSNSQRWMPYVAALDQDEYTIHAIDFPGHGMAKGKSLHIEMCREALMQTIARVGEVDTIIGHSLGSLITAYSYVYDPSLPIRKFVIMGAPSGMDAIFEYFEMNMGLSQRSIRKLGEKVDSILRIPHKEISLANFFAQVKQPVLVVHEESDLVTPWEPIKIAIATKKNITSFTTDDLDHNLRGDHVVDKVIHFINKPLCT